MEERVLKGQEDLGTVVDELRQEINEKSEEISAIRESKRVFGERRDSGDWKTKMSSDVEDAYMLGRVTGKGYETNFAKNVMEKVNNMSGVAVSSADFEQVVSSNVERDIQLELKLAPLFREIQMSSATQILPVMPDSGYAEFVSAQMTDGVSPHGNLAQRGDQYKTTGQGDRGGIDMTETSLTTKKLISRTYLGNETEEDAIIPILPLIREAVIRSQARSVENMILVGNTADSPFGSGGASPAGLIAYAGSNKTQHATAYASHPAMVATELLAARKNMGKYGVRPEDVVYIVSLTKYHELISDTNFADVSQVDNASSTKLTGQVGQVYGSPVIVSDEFATAATSKFYAVAVNPRNFVMPRLRGVTVESDYEVAEQRRVLVASQRIGFSGIIAGTTAAWPLQFKAS